ncbi:MAG: EVE domain-containing protein [Ruminococcus flavefaciens]|nr:EVE domain-containing protein [Ruminococcus flavefaciens]
MNYFLVSLRYDNFKQLQESGFEVIGFPEHSKMIESVKPGDKFVLYIGSQKSLIPGVVEAASECFWDNELIWDDIYPKRVKMKVDIMLKPENYVSMKEIKNGLSFINPEVKKFGVYLMKGIRKLSEQDYSYIMEKVRSKNDC